MFTPPVSAAMDATAASGGPITILPQIITGSPESIVAQAEHVLAQAAQFAQLVEQLEQAGQQLTSAWSGAASRSAASKLEQSVTAFNTIITVMKEGAALLHISAGMVQTAQTGYTSVVSAVNPTVAALMSNPWTYGAAVALSTGTSASLRGFVTAVEGMLTALGAGRFATQVMTLMQLIAEIETLIKRVEGAGAESMPGATSSPVAAPSAPPAVASQSGLAAAGWIATDGGSQGATGLHQTVPTGGSVFRTGDLNTVTVGARDGGVETFVEVPSGHDVTVHLDVTVDGHHVVDTTHLATDGTVTDTVTD